jgi:glycosyltransferase involved in cell wall biosynthesis
MENLPISVITITKNEERTIEETLRSIQRNNPAEIIMVDGNSTDRTVEIARRYTQRIFSAGDGGRSCARQIGAEQATQEYIAYVDAGVTLTEGALATMLAELQGSDYISIGARGAPDKKPSSYWEWGQDQHTQISNPEGRPAGIGMAASLFRRETILKYGFELGYGGNMDDVDLSLRLRRDGYTHGSSSARVYYHPEASLRSFARHRFLLNRQIRCWYIRKYGPWHAEFWPPLTTLYWLGFCLIKGKLRLIPYEIVDGITETAGMIKGFFGMIGEVLKKQ